MDNAQKAIMIGVGLFITIIIIAAVMLITGMGQDLLNTGTSQLSGISAQLEQSLIDGYDQKQMSGAQVLSAIKKYYSDPEMIVALYNTSSASTVTSWATPNKTSISGVDSSNHATVTEATAGAAVSNNSSRDALSTYSQAGHTNQIVTTAQYRSILIKRNGAVLGIAFVRL